MIKKRTLLIGPKNSGKTLLARYLDDDPKPAIKKANIVYGKTTIDAPGTYLESPWMHKHLISLQQSAYQVLFLLPVHATKLSYPPGFAQVFQIPVLGVITFTQDCPGSQIERETALNHLKKIGLTNEILFVNVEDQTALEEIKKRQIRGEVK